MDYNEYICDVGLRIGNLESTLRGLEDKKKRVLEDLEDSVKERSYLKRVMEVSKNIDSFYQWSREVRYGGSVYYLYKAVEYDFSVLISERTDLKRWKWEVKVFARKFTFDGRLNRGYIDYEYGSRKYRKWEENSKGEYQWTDIEGGVKLRDKFTCIEDAKKFAFDWMIRLEDDHKEELLEEKGLVGFFRQEDFDYTTVLG